MGCVTGTAKGAVGGGLTTPPLEPHTGPQPLVSFMARLKPQYEEYHGRQRKIQVKSRSIYSTFTSLARAAAAGRGKTVLCHSATRPPRTALGHVRRGWHALR